MRVLLASTKDDLLQAMDRQKTDADYIRSVCGERENTLEQRDCIAWYQSMDMSSAHWRAKCRRRGTFGTGCIYNLGLAKTYTLDLSKRIHADPDNQSCERKGCNQRGSRAIKRGLSCHRALGAPCRAIGSPYSPCAPRMGPLLCRSQSPGPNCIGPLGASKKKGLGQLSAELLLGRDSLLSFRVLKIFAQFNLAGQSRRRAHQNKKKTLHGEMIYAPSLSPFFCPAGIFEGMGGGVYFEALNSIPLPPSCIYIYIHTHTYGPPTPRRVFSGIGGGVEAYKI